MYLFSDDVFFFGVELGGTGWKSAWKWEASMFNVCLMFASYVVMDRCKGLGRNWRYKEAGIFFLSKDSLKTRWENVMDFSAQLSFGWADCGKVTASECF